MLRLSVAMAYKNALAGLDHGGGKAVIIGDPAQVKTEALLRAYGRFVASLGGRYVTACDVGTYSEDMDIIARECPWTTGRTTANGGAGDSSVLTAMGVMHGMRAAAEHAWGRTSLRGRTVGVEGVGKVGHRLVDHLVEDEAEVVICDVSPAAVEAVRSRHPQVRAVADVEALIGEELDILAPCALGGTLTEHAVNTLTARIVCGAANNQLAHHGIEKLLADRGILYAPDYVVNAGGVIQVADETSRLQLRASPRRNRTYFRHDRQGARHRGRRRGAAIGRRGPPRRAADGRCGPAPRNLAGHDGISVGIRGAKRVRLYLYGCW